MTGQVPLRIAPGEALAERFAARLVALRVVDLPARTIAVATDDLIDAAGLCVAARKSDYIAALLAGWDGEGRCTAIGHARGLDAAGAALVNGTAIHGEDFDDTLEGAPIRVGAMVIPAVLAACERHDRSGEDALRGIVAGLEAVCRVNQVVPGAIHKAGFHPVGVLGALGAAAGAGVALGLDAIQLARALGIAGSFASGIGEFLTEGAWTKRLHPGWAAHSGYRAAMLAHAGFIGPRTVFEGRRNVFRVFGRDASPNLSALLDGLGETFLMEAIAFKPYACGTMIHPYIDCMIELAATGVAVDDIVDIVCEAAEGPVDRLWEPLADKRRPSSGYAAKFSMPFGMAVGFLEGDAGLAQFTDEKALDPRILALAGRIRYVVDPANPYPVDYTGHVRATLRDGSIREIRRAFMRGGRHAPMTRNELVAKFRGNIAHGGMSDGAGERLLDFCLRLPTSPDLTALSALRSL
ncbi:MAG: MmgE/PrpD family protein [Burkholderiales bacterium]|nr:MmgE/PrpD family protein [Burkholderiales bacterium]